MSTASGLTLAIARRSLLTLRALGYVEEMQVGFRLTSKVIELADSSGWVEVARLHLTALRDEVGENVSALVLDHTDVVYLFTSLPIASSR